MNNWFRRSVAAATMAAMPLSLAAAQEGMPVATFESWNVHVFDGADGKTCIVASQPIAMEPEVGEGPGQVRRSQVLFMVTDWPADGVQHEIRAQMGYPLGANVTITIDGGEAFTLSPGPSNEAPEDAWLPSAVEDELLTDAMKRGRTMVVRARSTRGTNTVDTYSLIGISAALARAAEECG